MKKDKADQIINSAIKQFSKYGYQKTSIDSIVQDAGVSKGILFYHFKSKKELYLYLIQYIGDIYIEEVTNRFDTETTDFIEMLKNSTQIKLDIALRHPYTMEFFMRLLSEEEPLKEVKDYLEKVQDMNSYELYHHIITKADVSKFRDGIDIHTAFKVATWISQGFLEEGKFQTRQEIEANFPEYEKLITKLLYKEFHDG